MDDLNELTDQFLEEISCGSSFIKAFKTLDESYTTFFKMKEDPNFNDRLNLALNRRSEYLFEQILDLGIEAGEGAAAAQVKVKIDALRFIIATQNPDKYGGKASGLDDVGVGGVIVETGIRRFGDKGYDQEVEGAPSSVLGGRGSEHSDGDNSED